MSWSLSPVYRWLVVICREGESDVTSFEERSDAQEYFNAWSAQWTESFLCKVIAGPGPAELYAACEACHGEPLHHRPCGIPDCDHEERCAACDPRPMERALELAQALRDGCARDGDVKKLVSLLLDGDGRILRVPGGPDVFPLPLGQDGARSAE